MRKKVLIIIAIIVVLCIGLFVLTGCGDNNEEGTTPDEIESKTASTETKNINTSKQENKNKNNVKIGEYVHYNVNLDIGNISSVDDDWVVFFEDKEKGITYLIAADYVTSY